MRIRARVTVLVVAACLLGSVGPAPAQTSRDRTGAATRRPAGASAPLPAAAPEALGLSAERLARLDAVMQRYVDEGRIAGITTLVMRHGRIAHLKSYGMADLEQQRPMTSDALMRLASMSKAVTSVAVMMLVEEGALLLSDPVSKYIPSFRQTYVAVPPPPGTVPAGMTGTSGAAGAAGAAAAAGAAGAPGPVIGPRLGSVPAKRPITIRDLLTHTSGISYGGGALEAEYRAANTYLWYCADHDETIGSFVDRLATLPFQSQPGEQYVYGFSTDVLGRVIEVASGMPLDEVFRTRIFEPLRMADTFFYVPADKASRLATVYGARPDGTIERAPERGLTGQGEYVEGPRTCFAGGAGLVSTIHDYARFLQMLLNGGDLDGARILSPASVASMTSNHVGTLYREGAMGFGLGFEVIEHVGRAGRLGAQGEFSWGSAYYSRYFVDPADGVVAIFMSQLIPSGGLDLQDKFRSLVYQAIVRPGREPSASAPARR